MVWSQKVLRVIHAPPLSLFAPSWRCQPLRRACQVPSVHIAFASSVMLRDGHVTTDSNASTYLSLPPLLSTAANAHALRMPSQTATTSSMLCQLAGFSSHRRSRPLHATPRLRRTAAQRRLLRNATANTIEPNVYDGTADTIAQLLSRRLAAQQYQRGAISKTLSLPLSKLRSTKPPDTFVSETMYKPGNKWLLLAVAAR